MSYDIFVTRSLRVLLQDETVNTIQSFGQGALHAENEYMKASRPQSRALYTYQKAVDIDLGKRPRDTIVASASDLELVCRD